MRSKLFISWFFLLLIVVTTLFPVMVYAAEISGTVRDTDSNPLSGVCIHVFSDLCGNNYINNATSDADGSYRVVVPVSGMYYVQALPQCSYSLAVIDEWWTAGGGTRICEDAEPVSVSSAETSGIDFSLDPAAVISGTVSDTDSNPLSNVYVNIYLDQCLGSSRVNRFTGVSNENGDYRTVVPVNGKYYAYADPHAAPIDNLNLTVLDEWWTTDEAGTLICEDASPISVDIAAEYPGIDFFLDPAAIISGTVRDTDGNPLPEVYIIAYDATCAELYNNGVDYVIDDMSDSDGNYNLSVPINGDYYVVAIIFEPYRLEWWTENGQTTICEEASPISVAVAEHPGVDFYFAIPDRNHDGDVDGMDLAMMITDFNSGLVSNVELETFAVEFGRVTQ